MTERSGEIERVYLTRCRLEDGTETDQGRFTTKRQRSVGEIVNLPVAADGVSHPGKGFIWRVSAVAEAEDPSVEAVLILDFEASYSQMQESRGRN